MKIKSIIGVAYACLTVVSMNVHAVGINGLDWLPFSATWSMSTNQVDAALLPGGTLEGWRFASNLEVEGMLTSIHPGWIEDDYSTANIGIVDELAGLLGYTFLTTAGVAGAREIFGATGDSGGGCCRAAFALSDGFRGEPAGELVDKTIINRNWATSVHGRPVASFLVSSVPVPAAVWLFGSGLLGLIGFSKRKKTA